ncbi:efflux transporter outer membrane subunit [Janthinobacterium fluminis]|uniref:Efflux transporter outer membrane subunit n=1 Tax=Janthinobacterium fluminis TaxID=2987524 RepID=A0ABT5K2S7_9BURK|nr:efflux transporter outer membrane subunit [Janthinobacterium fluminis]MDC8759275.1 efflux transporter outer membrane subunit [Janthinobacterium fluminis]
MTKPDTRLGTLLLAGALAGCSLAPAYQRPEAPVAPAYPAAGPDGAGPAAADTAWRSFFSEPRLQQVIAAALRHNRDLRAAALRIEEARAQYTLQSAERLPALNASLGAARTRTPAALNQSGRAGVGERFDAGLSMAAFELDYLGRVRSLGEAALALYLASDEARQAAQIGVVAETAKAWFSERALAEQYALAAQTLAGRQRTFELTRQRLDAGAASRLDLRQNETLYQSARVAALTLARQRAQAENALTLLVGQAPAAPPAGAGPDDAALDAMSALPAGLPSELLARRPDIRAAELRLKAANANIGAARAAFFPRLSLTAALGSASAALSGLFDSGSGNWSFTPQLQQAVFDGGRNRANLSLSETRRHLAVADYEKTIQVAFREVADALAARTYLGEQVAAQLAARAAQAERLALLQLRFDNGVASALDVLDAQRELFGAEQALVQARLLRTTSAVDLYRALGGGWQ